MARDRHPDIFAGNFRQKLAVDDVPVETGTPPNTSASIIHALLHLRAEHHTQALYTVSVAPPRSRAPAERGRLSAPLGPSPPRH